MGEHVCQKDVQREYHCQFMLIDELLTVFQLQRQNRQTEAVL